MASITFLTGTPVPASWLNEANQAVYGIGSTAGYVWTSNGDGTLGSWQAAGGGGTWGSITGTLADQTDLQAVLDTIVTDHGGLTGLADDDHTQYLLADGTRALTGKLYPTTDNTIDLGDATHEFRNLYVDGVAFLDGVSVGGSAVFEADDTGIGWVSQTEGIYGKTSGNYIYYVANSVEQAQFHDGKIIPTTDNDIDLGDATHEFKDLYVDGTAFIDNFDSITVNSAYTLPTTDGTTDYVLSTNGAGVVSWVAASGGVTDHGALTGLTDDDHTQYALANGSRAITGDQTYTTASILMSDNEGMYWGSANGVFGLDSADVVGIRAGGSNVCYFNNTALYDAFGGVYDLGTSGNQFRNLYIDGTAYIDTLSVDVGDITMADTKGVIFGTSDYKISGGPGTGVLTFRVGGGNILHLNTSALYDGTGSVVDLGTSGNQFRDIYIDRAAYIDAIGEHLPPLTDDAVDLGNASAEYRNLYLDGTALVDNVINSTTQYSAVAITIADDGVARINFGSTGCRVGMMLVMYNPVTTNDNTQFGIVGNQTNNPTCTLAGGASWGHLTPSDTAPTGTSGSDAQLNFQSDVSGSYVWIENRLGASRDFHIVCFGAAAGTTTPITATTIV